MIIHQKKRKQSLQTQVSISQTQSHMNTQVLEILTTNRVLKVVIFPLIRARDSEDLLKTMMTHTVLVVTFQTQVPKLVKPLTRESRSNLIKIHIEILSSTLVR
jgi:hypothetical protein